MKSTIRRRHFSWRIVHISRISRTVRSHRSHRHHRCLMLDNSNKVFKLVPLVIQAQRRIPRRHFRAHNTTTRPQINKAENHIARVRPPAACPYLLYNSSNFNTTIWAPTCLRSRKWVADHITTTKDRPSLIHRTNIPTSPQILRDRICDTRFLPRATRES